MRHALLAAAAAIALAPLCQPAQAQGFFKRLAARTLDKVEQKAEDVVGEALEGSNGAPSEPAPVEEKAKAADTTPQPEGKPRPEPEKRKAAKYVNDLRTPPDVEAKKAAYNKFGEARCRACEGGIELDGRPKFPYDQYSGKYNERAARAGNWPVGHTHRWKGLESNGTLTVKAEDLVEGFRCRWLEYRLDKGATSITRPGLICYGLANSSSEVENWHEIY